MLAVLVAQLILLSCSDPFSELVQPGPGTPPSAYPVVSASVVGFRHDSTDGGDWYRLIVQAFDSLGRPAGNVPLAWNTLVPDDSVNAADSFGPDGSATVFWVTRDTLAPLHLLELYSGHGPVFRISGRGQEPGSTPVGGFPVDTVLGEVQGGIAVRLLGSEETAPIGGQVLVVRVAAGGGRVGSIRLVTDSTGLARTQWWFGRTAGMQTVEVSATLRRAYRLQDLRTGATTPTGGTLAVSGIALPGVPQRLSLARDTLLADAIGAHVRIAALAHDSYGNATAQPPLELDTPDSTVAQKQGDGSIRTVAPGIARVYVTAGSAFDSAHVLVMPKAVSYRVASSSATLNYVGARAVVGTFGIDRLGSSLPVSNVSYRNLTPGVARVAGADTVVALQPGLAMIEATIADSVTDTVSITSVQVPASVVSARLADTVLLDQTVTPQVQVIDSGGTAIPASATTFSSSDSTIVTPQGATTLVARFPGEVTISARSGSAVGSYRVTVEGVAFRADGVRNPGTSAVNSAKTIELSNGRVRLRRGPGVGERGAFIVETRQGDTWYPATAPSSGDWLYVTSTVVTEPTSITVVEDRPDRIGIAMRFGDHRFDPVLGGFPASFQNQPFPFTRTVWLSPGQYGYFSWTQLETTLPYQGYTELEVGFGGLFGPATITTGQQQLRTDTMTVHHEFNTTAVPDAASFDRDGDPLIRVLVPLPEAPMISPVFTGRDYGSVYVHRLDYQSYGAYLFAAPRDASVSPHQLCLEAWATAPFPLRALSASEAAQCGGS